MSATEFIFYKKHEVKVIYNSNNFRVNFQFELMIFGGGYYADKFDPYKTRLKSFHFHSTHYRCTQQFGEEIGARLQR